MATQWIELPVSSVTEDESYPDRDTRYIYEHLKFLLSFPSPYPLPAIRACAIDQKIVVTHGQKYLRIAKELGRHSIRVMLELGSGGLGALSIHLPTGYRIIPEEELQRELDVKVDKQHHVFYFEDSLDLEQQKIFGMEISNFLERRGASLMNPSEVSSLKIEFPFDATCAVFEVSVPMHDHTWATEYRSICQQFSTQIKKIITFQGALFV